MSAPNSHRQHHLRPGATTFIGCLRQFLTPQVWKQAHQAHAASRHRPKCWDLHPMLMTLLLTTWCTGDSQAERFETARAYYVAMYSHERRPGVTITGFQKALARVPLAVLRALAVGVRAQLLLHLGVDLEIDGFIPLGCDGTRLTCPRTPALEQRLGQGAQAGTPPFVWVTALVHGRFGLLWAWWIGKGDASERDHLRRLRSCLPAKALVIADAGYQGYALLRDLLAANVCFLVRVSTQAPLYSEDNQPLHRWREGLVYWWTNEARRTGRPPLRLRLIRVHRRRKVDVWLLTNVDSQHLTVDTAAKFYGMRWENEGFFRTFKHTLGKVKLQSRTVRLIHREVEGALLGVQLLLAQGTYALCLLGRKTAVSSPRQVLLEIRRHVHGRLGARQHDRYLPRLARLERERRRRQTPKVSRKWPERKDHTSPKPPKIRPLTAELKSVMEPDLHAA